MASKRSTINILSLLNPLSSFSHTRRPISGIVADCPCGSFTVTPLQSAFAYRALHTTGVRPPPTRRNASRVSRLLKQTGWSSYATGEPIYNIGGLTAELTCSHSRRPQQRTSPSTTNYQLSYYQRPLLRCGHLSGHQLLVSNPPSSHHGFDAYRRGDSLHVQSRQRLCTRSRRTH